MSTNISDNPNNSTCSSIRAPTKYNNIESLSLSFDDGMMRWYHRLKSYPSILLPKHTSRDGTLKICNRETLTMALARLGDLKRVLARYHHHTYQSLQPCSLNQLHCPRLDVSHHYRLVIR